LILIHLVTTKSIITVENDFSFPLDTFFKYDICDLQII